MKATRKSCPPKSRRVPTCGRKLSKRSADEDQSVREGENNKQEEKNAMKTEENSSLEELLCCIRATGKPLFKKNRRHFQGARGTRPYKSPKRGRR